MHAVRILQGMRCCFLVFSCHYDYTTLSMDLLCQHCESKIGVFEFWTRWGCTFFIFKAMLSGEMRESRAREIVMPDVRHSIFLAVLEYLYTDEVEVRIFLILSDCYNRGQ